MNRGNLLPPQCMLQNFRCERVIRDVFESSEPRWPGQIEYEARVSCCSVRVQSMNRLWGVLSCDFLWCECHPFGVVEVEMLGGSQASSSLTF